MHSLWRRELALQAGEALRVSCQHGDAVAAGGTAPGQCRAGAGAHAGNHTVRLYRHGDYATLVKLGCRRSANALDASRASAVLRRSKTLLPDALTRLGPLPMPGAIVATFAFQT
jgi:hypothetical protein